MIEWLTGRVATSRWLLILLFLVLWAGILQDVWGYLTITRPTDRCIAEKQQYCEVNGAIFIITYMEEDS